MSINRVKKTGAGWFALFSAALMGFTQEPSVVINEFVAGTSDRLLHFDEGGVPHLGMGWDWYAPEFNDSTWESGPGPIGFGDAGLNTDVGGVMQGVTPALYLRNSFDVSAATAARTDNLQLLINYDDGFIAYLNGVEIARRNMGASPLFAYHDQVAFAGHEATQTETIALSPANTLLKTGQNVLAIQVHNEDASNNDLQLSATLRLAGSPSLTLVNASGPWQYFPGVIEPSGGVYDVSSLSSLAGSNVKWGQINFDDSGWRSGAGPVGYDANNDYELGVNLVDEMRYQQISLYWRAEFSLTEEEISDIDQLRFVGDYDDGFVAYLNGEEIARGNLGGYGEFVSHSQSSDGGHNANGDNGGSTQGAEETTFVNPGLLQPGKNVFAAQVHNSSLSSSDLILRAELTTLGGADKTLVASDSPVKFFIGATEPAEITDSGETEDNEPGFTDWIELANVSDQTINLLGWSLTDDANSVEKWKFPDVDIAPGQFLLVFASGQDKRTSSGILQTNFSLDQGGEYLGLFNAQGELVSEVGEFPEQSYFYSCGIDPDSGEYRYFGQPTPGAPNEGPVYSGIVAAPVFDHESGFYSNSQTLGITTPTSGATIRYTLDGATPSETEGNIYSSPVNLTGSRSVRAIAYKEGWIPSKVANGSFLINESSSVRALPAICLVADPERDLFKPMGTTAIEGGAYTDGGQWVSRSTSDYNIPMHRGRAFERPASLEMLYDDGREGFQIDMGMRIAASDYSRRRVLFDQLEGLWTRDSNNKPQWNFYFRKEYGPGRLQFPLFPGARVESFDNLRLRSGKNDWNNPFIRDELMRRMLIATGQVSPHGILCNLFVNGEFKAYYNLTERVREEFLQEWHHSDRKWDVLVQFHEVVDGDNVAYNELRSFLRNNNMADLDNYRQAAQMIDLTNIVDYLLVNIYGATWDWPHNNYVIARERSLQGQWRLYMWDAEGAFGLYGDRDPSTYNVFSQDLITGNLQTEDRIIPLIYSAMRVSPEFRLLFADRIQKHFSEGGALTRQSIRNLMDELATQLDPTMRYMRGVAVSRTQLADWINRRESTIFSHFRSNQLWPALTAPAFDHGDGELEAGETVGISSESGQIFYTTDGSDPRALGGAIQGKLYTGPIPVDHSMTIKARVLSSGEWSPLQEASYAISETSGLRITELNYHPSDSDGNTEFLEIKNSGASTFNLAGYYFEGIEFVFPGGFALAPGEFAVLVSDPVAFAARYPGVSISGTYTRQLDNSGEEIALYDFAGNLIDSVDYNDAAPWPAAADGLGFTLVLDNNAANPDLPQSYHWRASAEPGGSPAADDPPTGIAPVLVNEILANSDAGQDFIELFNPNDQAADVSGWLLTDDRSLPAKYQIASGTIIPAKDYLVFNEEEFGANPADGSGFGLSDSGEEVYLFSANADQTLTGYSHGFSFAASEVNTSFGRYVISTGEERFPAQSMLSFGAANSGPKTGPVVITEMMFNPNQPDEEFLEIKNITSETVLLYDPLNTTNTWSLGGLGFDFPENASLEPEALALVTKLDPAIFRQRFAIPAEVQIFGPYPGQLDNGGETIVLRRPGVPDIDGVPSIIVEEVKYDNHSPWPEIADGTNKSIERTSTRVFGDDPASWKLSDDLGGTPGVYNSTSVSFANWELSQFTEEERNTPGKTGMHDDFEGDGILNFVEYAYGLDPRTPDDGSGLPALVIIQDAGEDFLGLRYRRLIGADDVSFELSFSSDLLEWTPADENNTSIQQIQANGDGTETVVIRVTSPIGEQPVNFLRWVLGAK